MIPVIIPYYKAPEKIDRCLKAVNAQTYSDIELFVRDNSEDNILYTKAINEGLKKYAFSGSKFALVLTQDAYLTPDCLEQLLSCMIKNPKCGIVAPLQMANGKVTWGGSAAAWPGGQHVHAPEMTEPFETFWANGACMLLRTDMIKEIGLMDESLRFVCSDSDYSFTARSRGWKVMVQPNAIMEHELDGSASFGKNPWLDQVKLDDFIYFTEKWISGDLYKRLSFEGKEITNSKVRNMIYEWRAMKKKISVFESRALFSELLPELDPLDKSQGQVSNR